MSDDRSSGPGRWLVILGILVVAALLALIAFLHLSGSIGPDLH
jgi:hypothetical protein